VAKSAIYPPRKQRTREHVLADLSANYVEKFALRCGFAVERIHQDYGIDLAVFTFDANGFIEGGVVWMQLKATDRAKSNREGGAIIVRLDRRDVLAWIAEANPIILVLYDAAHERAYWLSIQNYFAAPQAFARIRGQTVTVPIPKTNRMSAKAMREFAREKARHAPQG